MYLQARAREVITRKARKGVTVAFSVRTLLSFLRSPMSSHFLGLAGGHWEPTHGRRTRTRVMVNRAYRPERSALSLLFFLLTSPLSQSPLSPPTLRPKARRSSKRFQTPTNLQSLQAETLNLPRVAKAPGRAARHNLSRHLCHLLLTSGFGTGGLRVPPATSTPPPVAADRTNPQRPVAGRV
jgi:hypothetical protein